MYKNVHALQKLNVHACTNTIPIIENSIKPYFLLLLYSWKEIWLTPAYSTVYPIDAGIQGGNFELENPGKLSQLPPRKIL